MVKRQTLKSATSWSVHDLATNKDMKYVLIWLIYEFIRGKFIKLWYYLLTKMQ
jgi:hypothetical protein